MVRGAFAYYRQPRTDYLHFPSMSCHASRSQSRSAPPFDWSCFCCVDYFLGMSCAQSDYARYRTAHQSHAINRTQSSISWANLFVLHECLHRLQGSFNAFAFSHFNFRYDSRTQGAVDRLPILTPAFVHLFEANSHDRSSFTWVFWKYHHASIHCLLRSGL